MQSWQGQQRDPKEAAPEVLFHTPPRLHPTKQPTVPYQDPQAHANVSTASSSRSEATATTLANRLKSKGEMLASKNQQSDNSYVPSIMSKE